MSYTLNVVIMYSCYIDIAGSDNCFASKDNNEEAVFHNPGKFDLYFCTPAFHYLIKCNPNLDILFDLAIASQILDNLQF
jgi:hypothetical protein